MIKLIGYEKSVGSFTPEGGGSAIEYNNRNLLLITNEGLKDNQSGCIHAVTKVKTSVLCASFGSTLAERDQYLDSILDREVKFDYGMVQGKLGVTGFKVLGDKK